MANFALISSHSSNGHNNPLTTPLLPKVSLRRREI